MYTLVYSRLQDSLDCYLSIILTLSLQGRIHIKIDLLFLQKSIHVKMNLFLHK